MNSGKELLHKLRRKCWESTRWRIAKEKPVEEEVSLRSGGCSEESRNISLENEVKIVGQESSLGSARITCSESKGCRRARWERKR